jgi:tetratricopeptide (TPR) repeat protein
LGILLIILRHLPEAAINDSREIEEPSADKKLLAKGLPAEAFSKVKTNVQFWIKKTWIFILEAKDLKPHAAAGYRMKKIFSRSQPSEKKFPPAPITTHEVKNEQYYLSMIKLQPKHFEHYDALGKFYLEQGSLEDARDIYQYLASHQPTSPEFQARLAYCYYQTKQFEKAAEHYQKSLGLDSTQPNRYYNLGLSLEAGGKLPEAIKSFDQAIALEPKNSKYYLSLSNTYAKMGNTQKAKELLLQAQVFDPSNELIKSKLTKYT